MEPRLDEIDRQIIYALMTDARNTSAPEIAAEVDVSPGTIRNRIARLEELDIIGGYHAQIHFDRADGRLTNLYICNASVAERESIASRVRTVRGVVNVRELMTGRRNLHVLAVGTDISDLRRIARAISSVGVEIEDENLVQAETFHPYAPYGPEDEAQRKTLSDFVSLAGGSEIVEATVGEGSPIAGYTLAEASERGLLTHDTLAIAIERNGSVLIPHGDTVIRADDVVTVFSRGGIADDTLSAFQAEAGRE
ncbi:AsnC family transcriptional regulator [Haloferacaceae archaeon DSL9]